MLTESITLLIQINSLAILLLAFLLLFRFVQKKEKDKLIERTISACSDLRSNAWKVFGMENRSTKKNESNNREILLIETIRKYDAAAALVIRGYYEKEIFKIELEYEIISLLSELSNSKIGSDFLGVNLFYLSRNWYKNNQMMLDFLNLKNMEEKI